MITPASTYEKWFLQSDQFLQFALHIKNPSRVNEIVEKFKKLAIGTRLRYDGSNFVPHDQDNEVIRLPENFKNLREAALYMEIHHTPEIHRTLATIGANSDTVILNSNHSVSDGVCLLNMFNTIRDNLDFDIPYTLHNGTELFKEEADKSVLIPVNDLNNTTITRFFSKDPTFLCSYPFLHRTYHKSNIEDLQCYNKELRRPTGLTDALYAQLILSASAYEGKFDNAGVKTVMNMRPFMKTQPTFENGCVMSNIPINADVTIDSTVSDLMKKTRESFNKQIQLKIHFGFHKAVDIEPNMKQQVKGIIPILSNLGQFKLGGGIDDVWVQCSYRNKGLTQYLTLVHFGIIGEGRNETVSQFMYTPNEVSIREAELFTKSIHYGLENIKSSDTIGMALEKMEDFQQKYIKEEFPKFLH